jgi:hypothetical protein
MMKFLKLVESICVFCLTESGTNNQAKGMTEGSLLKP